MVLTGMLMAWAESCSFLTRRPKYSSLQQHTELAAVTSCNTHQNTLSASQTKVILPDKPLLPAVVFNKVCMACLLACGTGLLLSMVVSMARHSRLQGHKQDRQQQGNYQRTHLPSSCAGQQEERQGATSRHPLIQLEGSTPAPHVAMTRPHRAHQQLMLAVCIVPVNCCPADRQLR